MSAKFRLLMALSLAMLASACGKDDNAVTSTAPSPETSLSPQAAPGSESASESVPEMLPPITMFDINDIPVTNADIGEFPHFMPPKGYRYTTDLLDTLDESKSIRESARTLYAIGVDRIHLVEGRTLKVTLYNEKAKDAYKPDLALVQRHYEDAITAAGGVRVFNERPEAEETRGALAPKRDSSRPESTLSRRQVYVIHKQDGEVWFDVDCNGGRCVLIVTEKK
ncbi:MAG: hypothetical protein LBV29_05095 [Azoarcus sp.]|jgi:hypothetical protein|nr:hypothetical protein [Azoarcus sp.]